MNFFSKCSFFYTSLSTTTWELHLFLTMKRFSCFTVRLNTQLMFSSVKQADILSLCLSLFFFLFSFFFTTERQFQPPSSLKVSLRKRKLCTVRCLSPFTLSLLSSLASFLQPLLPLNLFLSKKISSFNMLHHISRMRRRRMRRAK